ncbi:CDGP domain-containing protein [Mycolicibacterium sp. XJ1819]
MKSLVALMAGLLAAGGIALAAPANAGCQAGWTPWGGGEICDGPIAPDGSFQRCQSVGVLGFGGTLPCFTLNVNNLEGQPPYVP